MRYAIPNNLFALVARRNLGMAHVKILPSQCPESPGNFRASASLYLYDTLGDLISLAGLDMASEAFTVWRVGMDLQQFWGFADLDNHHIHAWVGGGASSADVIHFFAHELSHLFLDEIDGELSDEDRADIVGFIARQSCAWARQVLKRKAAERNGSL